jgi:hypothetical protein
MAMEPYRSEDVEYSHVTHLHRAIDLPLTALWLSGEKETGHDQSEVDPRTASVVGSDYSLRQQSARKKD